MGRAVFADDEPLSMATTDLSPERPIREGSSSRGPAQEGGLPELFDAVRWRWRPTMLIATLFFLGATIYVERLPAQYDGKALLAISPRLSAPNAGADTVRVGAPKYVEYVIAAATVRRVALRHRRGPADAAGRRRREVWRPIPGTSRSPSVSRLRPVRQAPPTPLPTVRWRSRRPTSSSLLSSWRRRSRPVTRRHRRGACSRPRRSSSA